MPRKKRVLILITWPQFARASKAIQSSPWQHAADDSNAWGPKRMWNEHRIGHLGHFPNDPVWWIGNPKCFGSSDIVSLNFEAGGCFALPKQDTQISWPQRSLTKVLLHSCHGTEHARLGVVCGNRHLQKGCMIAVCATGRLSPVLPLTVRLKNGPAQYSVWVCLETGSPKSTS